MEKQGTFFPMFQYFGTGDLVFTRFFICFVQIVHVTGRYHRPEMSSDWSDTVFFAVCTPIESKPVTDVRHHPSPRATEFKAVHGPDMKFLEVSSLLLTAEVAQGKETILNSLFCAGPEHSGDPSGLRSRGTGKHKLVRVGLPRRFGTSSPAASQIR